ncbi:L-threonine 3-dehydrogenase [Pilatotrama ljubarskyi]|nr:L-threonine 3-dehydrogenase [Pilatotrama ljubarskyi]
MKALRYHGPKDIRLDNIPEPVVGPKQVKVKIAWCGICGTDLHTYEGHPMPGITPTATDPHPITGDTLPIVIGHEFSGTIVELGPRVDTSKYSIGQNVAVVPLVSCMQGDCPGCSQPDMCNHCTKCWALGMSSGTNGGLAEYAAVNQELVHVLPPNTSLEVGALIEPLAVVWRAAKRGSIKAGDKVLILGAGPIALLMLHVARVFGASWIGVSGRRPVRCELARKHGASAVFDTTNPGMDVGVETLKATGNGVDVVVDCAGSQVTLDTALIAVRAGGTIVSLADWQTKPVIDMRIMLYKEIVLTSSLGYSNDHPEVLKAIAEKRLGDLESLVTQRASLEEFMEKGIMALTREKDRHVKVLIHP